MTSKTRHKVCFEVEGVPSIQRSIGEFQKAGLDKFCVVVGSMAQQVMACVKEISSEVLFVYQNEPNGTGDAAKTAYDSLAQFGFVGPLLIAMGDRIYQHTIVRELIDIYERNGGNLVATVPRPVEPLWGRVLKDRKGAVSGIIEESQIAQALSNKEDATIDGQIFPWDAIEQAKSTNGALYLFSGNALSNALMELSRQKSEYHLTEAVNKICSSVKTPIKAVEFTGSADILGFKTVDELLRVEDRLAVLERPRRISSADTFLSVSEWLRLFSDKSPKVIDVLHDIYGNDESLIEEKRRAYIHALERFGSRFGTNRGVVVTRSPGRVNLMGRHVEHRGGCVNVISIAKEVICVAAVRDDEKIVVENVDDRSYPAAEFILSEYLGMLDWSAWLDYLDSTETQELVLNSRGKWENYVKAAVLRLQYSYRERRLIGMDMMFSGDIPVAAGLSSSSAIVVASAEAAVALNGVDLDPEEFVDLCGEGEWFVGSRGGAGDHAAMKYGRRGSITQLGFFPFRRIRSIPFGDDVDLVIANSFVEAKKSADAKDLFNQRIAEYEFGFLLLKQLFPREMSPADRLRDINPETIGLPQSRIYEMIRALPEEITLDDLRSFLSEDDNRKVDLLTSSHQVPHKYRIRSVVLYGVAECRRSFIAGNLLDQGDLLEFGSLMNISHDGDRICSYNNGDSESYSSPADDEYITGLQAALASENPEVVRSAQLEYQAGGYACSTPETDLMVDLAKSVEGVLGAQLSGAGLGGCVMMLVDKRKTESLITELENGYYKPRHLLPGITVCSSVAGSMVLEVPK